MTQVSDIGQDEAWGWPCPYCRALNPVEAVRCANCGSHLRDADTDDLFTTVAADNAEVVPPEVPFARDNMWTTDANAAQATPIVDDAVGESELLDEPADEPVPPPFDDVWDEPAWPNGSGAFTAEPAPRHADVIDEPLAPSDDPRIPLANGSGGPLFSSRTNGVVADAARTGPLPGAPGPSSGSPSAPFGPPPAPAPPAPPTEASAWPSPPSAPVPPASAPSTPPSTAPPVPDAHGLAAAVGRLRPEAAEAAAVPISVCGALLRRDEVVLAAVTGQMLGHPAVVVLTNTRVLVVNGRRWQPIVDIFDLTPDLVVRGRHDRDIASLTFSVGTQLSTVDAITEVALAVELAERIRGD
ncbi:hypothetical protein [Dermatobacter hominis]|uniref:hypothetical protein n=1 Tax=Dermatobacter hominis TaxID=2884263 RepID=UPI001D113EBA|nr:hypothetical protein [Dermatobacter hominis]UDY36782.1 hypothetical protein LH044_04410 [Dermatobacter hominis]